MWKLFKNCLVGLQHKGFTCSFVSCGFVVGWLIAWVCFFLHFFVFMLSFLLHALPCLFVYEVICLFLHLFPCLSHLFVGLWDKFHYKNKWHWLSLPHNVKKKTISIKRPWFLFLYRQRGLALRSQRVSWSRCSLHPGTPASPGSNRGPMSFNSVMLLMPMMRELQITVWDTASVVWVYATCHWSFTHDKCKYINT